MPWGAAIAAAGSIASSAISSSKKGKGGEIVDTTPPEYVGLRQPAAGGILDFIQKGGGDPYTGSYAAPLTASERSILDMIMGSTAKSGGSIDLARGSMLDTIAGKYLTPESNPYLKSTIDMATRPLIDQFNQQTMPGLRERFTLAGHDVGTQASSPFAETARRANRDLMNSISDVSTRISAGNYEAERGRQVTAAGQIPQLEQADLDRLVSTLNAAGLPRYVDQYGLDKALGEFSTRRSQFLDALRTALSAGQPNTTQTQGQPPSSSPYGDIANYITAAGLDYTSGKIRSDGFKLGGVGQSTYTGDPFRL